MKKLYLITQNYRGPKILFDPSGHNRPAKIMYIPFKKGQQISGVMQYQNGKPLLVMVDGEIPVPIGVVKEVVAKDILSNASGPSQNKPQTPPTPVVNSNPKIKYIDAMLIGAGVGVLFVYFAEKKGLIAVPDPKNKMYGAAAGALVAGYFIYRKSTSQKTTIKIVKP